VHAALALWGIEPAAIKNAIPVLTETLGDQHWHARWSAASALGKIGPAAKDALAELKKLAEQDQDQRVREAATEAIEKMQKAVK